MRARLITALLKLFAALPLAWNRRLAGLLGRLLYLVPNSLRRHSEINLRLCLPELAPAERRRLLKASLIETAKTALEAGPMWFWPAERLLPLLAGDSEGVDAVDAAIRNGRGALLATPHLGSWEMAGHFGAARWGITNLYRPPRMAAMDKLIREGRQRAGAQLATTDAKGVRQLYETLSRGGVVGILPDQDPGRSGVFAPFFGVPASSMVLLGRLARKTGIGVVNTFMGKGAVPMDDPHCLFTMGLGVGDYNNLAFADADLIITAGYDLVEYSPVAWYKPASKAKIIHIDFEAAEIDQHFPVTVDIVSDLADALWQINEELNKRAEGRLPLFDINSRKKLRDTMSADFAAEKDDAGFPVKPQKILWDVRQFMGPDDIVLSDVGAHKMWISRYYQAQGANTVLISNGFCSMGFSLPGAIGAKLACPDKRVLSINGDAGFLMNVQELETAVRYGLNIVIMVWVDGEYGLIKWKQQDAFDGRHSKLEFGNPDFEMLAKAFGMWGKTLKSAAELTPALEEAFRQKGPAIIAVPVDYRENRKLTARLGKVSIPM